MAGAMATTTSTIVYSIQTEKGNVDAEIQKTTEYSKGLKKETIDLTTTTDRLTGSSQGLTKTTHQVGIEQEYFAQKTKMTMREIHMANMSILGVNMSLLGMSFNLRNTGLTTEETGMEIMMLIARMQMLLSMANMSGAMMNLFAMATTKAAAASKAFSSSLWLIGIMWAMMATESVKLRMILGALAGVVLTLAAANAYLAVTEAFSTAMMPGGMMKVALAASVAAAFGAIMVGAIASSRAFSGGVFSTPTRVMIGETPEAVIPLQSPRAARLGLTGPGGKTAGIVIENLTVVADSPRTFYREMQMAAQNASYTRR